MAVNYWCIFLMLIWSGLSSAVDAGADLLYLKDGTVETSDRIWESDNNVHFILKGTRSVEIRYAKDFVLRIERLSDKKKGLSSTDAAEKKEGAPTSIPTAPQKVVVDDRKVNEQKGIAFYDPRRPQMYWANANSRHTTLNEAIEALAKQYQKPTQWILDHIGEENDLGKIHAMLVRHLAAQPAELGNPTFRKSEPKDKKSEIPKKESKLRMTPSDAIESSKPIPKGIQFYDPRRSEKYWVSPEKRFVSLKEALTALSEQYGRPIEWIEASMGDTNELTEIHENIQKALVQ